MKKHATALTIAIAALTFAGVTAADNVAQDAENDVLHGHGATSPSKSQPYVQGKYSSGEIGAAKTAYPSPENFNTSAASEQTIPGAADHDDHEDAIHAITQH